MQIKNILVAAVAASVASGHVITKNVVTTELRAIEQRAPEPQPLTMSPPAFGDPLSIINSDITLPPSIYSAMKNHSSTAMASSSSSSSLSASSSASPSMSSVATASGSMSAKPTTTSVTKGNSAAGQLSGLSAWGVAFAAGLSALALL